MVIMAAIVTVRMVVMVMITDRHSISSSVLISCVVLATPLNGRVYSYWFREGESPRESVFSPQIMQDPLAPTQLYCPNLGSLG